MRSAASTWAATARLTAARWRSCSIRLLGYAAFTLSGSRAQRTAFLHVDYRKIAPVEKELQVDARVDRIRGRKIFVTGPAPRRGHVLCDAEALFVKLNPGQP